MASKKALRIALAEMTIQGVATRRVKDVLESVLQSWRDRSLGVTLLAELDALRCKVSHGGLVQDAAVPVAAGI